MWETYGLDNEDLLWASIAFQGGIASQRQAVCGAISSGAVCLGLRHRCSLKETEKAKQARQDIRRKAGELFKSFAEKFNDIICRELMGVDASDPEAFRRFRESGMFEKKCHNFVRFVVEKLYELDGK